MTSALLIAENGLTCQELQDTPVYTKPETTLQSRTAYVVPKQLADNVPGAPADIDWDSTLQYRHHLWSSGLGVAEAKSVNGGLVVGDNTDHVEDDYIGLDASASQLHFAEEHGAGFVLMARPHLAKAAGTADDYRRVYAEVIARASKPVIRPGHHGRQCRHRLRLKVMDADKEIHVREHLPVTATMFTGQLSQPDRRRRQKLLRRAPGRFRRTRPLGIRALQGLGRQRQRRIPPNIGSTEALSRKIFETLTYHY